MVLGILIIIAGLVFRKTTWLQQIISYLGLKNGVVQFDVEKLSIILLQASIIMGMLMIIGELLAFWFENSWYMYGTMVFAIIVGLVYGAMQFNSLSVYRK